MLQIREDLLTINQYSRGGAKLFPLQSVVMHWTANPGLSAAGNKKYYEDRKEGKLGYGSAHYIVDDKEIIRCIPENEIAYHCGTSQKNPATGEYYTEFAKKKFGPCAVDAEHNSTNNCCIGIEMCPVDAAGHFSPSVWEKSKQLAADILKRHNLKVEDITYHSQIIGTWRKTCPKLFCDKPEEFERFKKEVAALLV